MGVCIKYRIVYFVIIIDIKKKLLLFNLNNRKILTIYQNKYKWYKSENLINVNFE